MQRQRQSIGGERMSLINKIKKGVASNGSNKGKLVYLKPDSKTRVRFLHEIEDGVEVVMHDSFDRGINVVCQEALGRDCDYCEDKDLRTREAYLWSVWDYEAKEVKLFLGHANNFSPLPNIIAMYETYGTIMDRDYVLQRDGSGTNSRYSVIPMDKVKFKNKNAKPYSEKKTIDILNKAFPADDSDEDDNDSPKKNKKGKGRKKEEEPEDDDEDEDDFEEESYEEMSAKELYMECLDRGIKVKKKQKPKYYIALLEEDDEEDEEEDDWDNDDDEDEEDDW